MNIASTIAMQRDRATTYCNTCGGSGQLRINLTGNAKLDYSTCPVCKGKGVQQTLKSTQYENITQPWRKEFTL